MKKKQFMHCIRNGMLAFRLIVLSMLALILNVDSNGTHSESCYKSKFGNNRQLHCFCCRGAAR